MVQDDDPTRVLGLVRMGTVEVNCVDPCTGETLVEVASERGMTEVVQSLLRIKADAPNSGKPRRSDGLDATPSPTGRPGEAAACAAINKFLAQ
mmetsp:Transcript_77204/g.206166  ORF Transcript_77204/g.206166 Transcript_77204/m.206166 type:complete len:93 (+) Transcript_77204:3-281(+)